MCLSISIHTFLGFALGEPNIFLKKGGEPLTLWTLLHQRGFAPNSWVGPLRHHSGPVPVLSSPSCYHHCDFLDSEMCTCISQTGGSASTLPRHRGWYGHKSLSFVFFSAKSQAWVHRPSTVWSVLVELMIPELPPHAALSRATCSGWHFCLDFARMATSRASLRLLSGGCSFLEAPSCG